MCDGRSDCVRVKYIGPEMVALEQNKVYEVLDIKHETYKVMTELDEEYYIPTKYFVIDFDGGKMYSSKCPCD